MKVLLTGATGFIGSHIARELLRAGHEVHAPIRPGDDLWRIAEIQSSLHLISGDLLDSSFILHPSSFDCCLHLAWYVEPGQYLQSPENQRWVEASLRLAKTVDCRRFVGAGSCFELVEPVTPYVRAKLDLLQALQSLEVPVAWVRFFYLYGPFEDPRRFVPVVINSLLRGQEAKLVPGDPIRDFLHVEDVASAVCAVAESALTGPVNIGSGVPTTVREIGLKIGEIIGRPELVKIGALPDSPTEPGNLLADNARLRSTGWEQKISLEAGLRETTEWWRRHPPKERPS